MNRMRTAVLMVVALLTAVASASALAHGGGYHGHPRVSIGFVYGGPYWGYPGYWGYPYYYPGPYYYPAAAGAPAEPTVYIERGDGQAPQEQSQGYWYYCPEAKAYHPYVKHCAGGWQRVTPQPPGG